MRLTRCIAVGATRRMPGIHDPTAPDANWSSVMAYDQPQRIEADYLLETAFDPGQAAEAMAGEQSSGTFVAIPGETPELKARAAARVEALRVLDDEVREPSLPFAAAPKDAPATWRRAHVTLSWPLDNLGTAGAKTLNTLAGSLFAVFTDSGPQ